ncbi:MAG: iron-sulfur cluster assembly accessory protein [Conexivisphaerales archaeon]
MQTVKPVIEVTPLAREKLLESLNQSGISNPLIRVGVSRELGGCSCCSSYRYSLSLKETADVEDVVEDVGGIRFAIDRVDCDFIRGSVLDYVETGEGSGFLIQNPNEEASSCGCGDQ